MSLTMLGTLLVLDLLIAIVFLFATLGKLLRRLERLEETLLRYGIDPDHEPEALHLNEETPDGCCGCCQRELEDDEPKLNLASIDEDGVQTFDVCRSCLSEHAPNMLAALESEAE